MNELHILETELYSVLPKDLIGDVYKYALDVHFKKWIPEEKIDWYEVSFGTCKGAVDMIRKKLRSSDSDKITWKNLSCGESKYAVELLKEKMADPSFDTKQIDWNELSFGICKEAVDMLREKLDDPDINERKKVNFSALMHGFCKEAVELLKENMTVIGLGFEMSACRSNEAILLLREKIADGTVEHRHIRWGMIAYCYNKEATKLTREKLVNPMLYGTYTYDLWSSISYGNSKEAVELIKEQLLNNDLNERKKINWVALSKCACRESTELIRQRISTDPDFVDSILWDAISGGHCDESVELIRNYPEKINWSKLSMSKFIYEYRVF